MRSTPAFFQGTTIEPPPVADFDEDAVAMIVGGFWSRPSEDGGSVIVAGVELFGCPDSVGEDGKYVSKPVDDFPVPVYLTAGVYYEEEASGGDTYARALFCGGFECQDGET